jgi:ABC-2 type transport system permease protein
MTRSPVIARRELSSYFYSPVAYVVMTIFLAVCGFLFFDDFQPGQVAAMRSLFEWMVFLLVFAVPLLSMGLMSQEWSNGTIETLMTAPVDEMDVILGKFMGSLGFFLFLLIPTAIYVILLAAYSVPSFDFGPIFSGYIGIILVGALFISIGLFCSSLTRSQVVAAVAAAAILFVITIVPMWVGQRTMMGGLLRTLADQMVFRRYTDFSRGIIDTGNLVFFLATTAVFLFLSVKALESRRWR